MGMAASQARLLNLTARKTNIEFHGQQINQQRTELSNESANLYNQMLSLQVPVPPNTQDFTKVDYSFIMPGGDTEANITQIVKSGSNYSVVFAYTTVELGMPACADNQKSTATGSAPNNVVSACTITTKDGRTFTGKKYNGSNAEGASDAQKQEYKIHHDAVSILTTQVSGAGDIWYINVGTEENPKYQYYTNKELAAAINSSASSAVTYYTATDMEKYNEDSYTPCTINRDKHNRVQSFTYTPTGGTSTTFAVTTKTITDEAAYNDAMNEYSYQSYLYEQEMNNINAQISIVHAQDRELELKLKQLDTEHNAVQTEIDSVKSIAKKNVEDSFKTFA